MIVRKACTVVTEFVWIFQVVLRVVRNAWLSFLICEGVKVVLLFMRILGVSKRKRDTAVSARDAASVSG